MGRPAVTWGEQLVINLFGWDRVSCECEPRGCRDIPENAQPILEQDGASSSPEVQAAALERLTTLFEALGSTRTRFVMSIIRQLTNGEPVDVAPVATCHDLTPEKATNLLRRIGANITPGGHAIALGVSLTPTPHRYRIADRQLYTWCAPDAILFPILFDQSATVSSSDPIDHRRVQLTVSPERIEECYPASAVVSLVAPEAREDVRAGSCAYGHLFATRSTAKQWTRRQAPEAKILTVGELHQIGRRLLRLEPLREAFTS